MDTYQAVYDAVRSKMSNGDIGAAVESALHSANLAHYAEMTARAFQEVHIEQTRPSVLFKPKLCQDGNQWCALYGADIQTGLCAFGDSPDDAMRAFDTAWYHKTTTKGA